MENYMWLFYKSGFLSIVENRFGKDKLLVRARVEEDLENFVSLLDDIAGTKHRIEETPERDYRFITTSKKEIAAKAIFQIVSSIDYDNFKEAVHGDSDRDTAYMKIWSVMNSFQEGR